MPLVPLNFSTRSNPTRTGFEGAARLVNCYAEPLGEDAKGGEAFYCVDGLDTYLTPAAGGCKVLLAIEDRLYGVNGTKVWQVNVNDAVTVIDTLAIEAPCFMARNRRNPTTQVGLVTDGKYYVLAGNGMTLNTDPDLAGPPSSIDVRDGHFIIPTNFGRFFITGDDNANSIDALDFGTAQRDPDEILRVIATETDIALMGTSSIEWHQNSPNELGAFPFVPIAQMQIGLIGAEAVAKLDRQVIWVASDGTVRLMQGYNGDRISSHAVERAVGKVSDPSQIVATAWNSRETGHSFFSMSSPEWTWEFNLRTGRWHERASYGMKRWRCGPVVEWQGRLIAGDAFSGELYHMSPQFHDEGGDRLIMTVQAPPVEALPMPVTVNGAFLDVAPGQGRVGGSSHNSDPHVMMDYSDDGGRTWGPQRTAAMGQAGETNRRCQWNRLGMIRRNGRTFRFSASADVTRAFFNAHLDVST